MTFPSRDDVKGLSQAFCENVCVCLFFWSRSGQRGEQHHKSMVAAITGMASQTLSTDTIVSVGNRLVGAREDYLNCGYSQSSPNKHTVVSSHTPSRFNSLQGVFFMFFVVEVTDTSGTPTIFISPFFFG